jgi:TolA-binding protein
VAEAPPPLADPLLEAATQRDEAPVPPREPKRAQTADAATLFHAASVARRTGDTTKAQKLYGQLIAQHPDSDEAHVAHVALGKLWLAAGRASAAEREFRQYLDAGGGPLSEEALFSRAQALQRLERTVEERAAWTKLLTSYPHSVYATHARERLGE